MSKIIKCPEDLNEFLLGEPFFKNTFSGEECEKSKFYGDCFHCFATAIKKRDYKIKSSNAKSKSVLEYITEKQYMKTKNNTNNNLIEMAIKKT